MYYKEMLHLHVFLWLRSLHIFYSLLKFLKTCEHLSVGNPFYLSNWRIRYSRMTWHLLIFCKVLEIYFYKTTQIACSLIDIQILTKAIYDLAWQNLPYMPLTLCWVWSSFVTPLTDVSCSQDQNSHTCQK